MKYAAAYIRVSDERQDEYSPDSQLKLIKEYARKNDFDIPEEYIFYDDGISGRSVKKRKAFQEMIGFAKSKEHPFDAIIVWKFSRFARNQEESIVYKSMLKKINVSVISVSETIDDSPFSPLIERIIEFMDEYYSTRLSQEVYRGMTEKASRGEPLTAPAFGYKLIDKQYYPDDNADIVRYIFNEYLNGKGVRKIAIDLGLKGVRTKRGNEPDYRFVEYILSNPVYIGKIRWCTEGKASSTRYSNNDLNVMIVDGKHEAIIDMETWNQVQDKLKEQKKRYGKYQRREQPIQFMLKGLLRCGNCGATLTHVSLKDPAVQCHNYARGQCKVSHHLSLKKANAIVIQALEESINSLNFDIIQKTNTNIEVVDYDLLIKKEQDKIKRASNAYDVGIDTLEDYGRKKRAYQNNINELIKQKKNMKNIDDNLITDKFIEKSKSVLDLIKNPAATEQSKNEALRTIIDHITYQKETQNLHIVFYI